VYHLISSHPGLPEPSYGILESKDETQWHKSISLLQIILNREYVRQMFATRTLLQVLFRFIFISLASCMEISNSMRIIYKTSLLTEPEDFLKSIKS